MPMTTTKSKELALEQGHFWTSFEQFRAQGNAALRDIVPGVVGTLATKQGQFRILTEADFQRIYGLAQDVQRLNGTLRVVVAAARGVERHRDETSLETFAAAVLLLGDLPSLPSRAATEPLQPEGFEVDDVDDLDLSNVPRPKLGKG